MCHIISDEKDGIKHQKMQWMLHGERIMHEKQMKDMQLVEEELEELEDIRNSAAGIAFICTGIIYVDKVDIYYSWKKWHHLTGL